MMRLTARLMERAVSHEDAKASCTSQGLRRLSQRSRWQDGRFALDRAASPILAMVDGGVRRQPLGGRPAASSVSAASWACESAVA
jgi:hypothetical protein